MTKKKILTKTRIGWREWVSLPELGLIYVKAKADTGAQTSALYAKDISTFKSDGSTWVRFTVHPIQYRYDIEVICTAPVVDERVVSDSGGHRERRYVIEVNFIIGSENFKAEITLANRENMSYRMLLGRQALAGRFVVDSQRSYILGQPKHVLRDYRRARKKK